MNGTKGQMDGFHPTRGQAVTPVKLQRSRDLRREMTEAERVLWSRLRVGQVRGLRFRRQQIIAGFIVDFYCHAARLVIELDGAIHAERADYDAERDAVLAAQGLRIARFTNDAVLNHLPDVLTAITALCAQRLDDRMELRRSPTPQNTSSSVVGEQRDLTP